MPAGAQASDVDATIHQLVDNPSVIGYVVLNAEGIPVKYHDKLPYEKAVTYACLMSDFHTKAKRALRDLVSGPDSEISNFRMRTAEGTELIGVAIQDFLLVVVQNCTGKPWKYPEDEAQQGADQPQT
jgi:hypothetical protein